MEYLKFTLLSLLLTSTPAFAADTYKLDIISQVQGRTVHSTSIQVSDGGNGSVVIPYGDPNTVLEIGITNSTKDGNPGILQKVALFNQDTYNRKTPLCHADILSTVGKLGQILCNKRPNKPPLLITILNHKI